MIGLTIIKEPASFDGAAVNPVAGTDILPIRAHQALTRSAFFTPENQFMVGRMGALRSAAPLSGHVSPVRPATRLTDINGGSSLTLSESTAMTELIPLTQRFIAGASTRTVSARKLHKFLSSKRQFSDWIRNRINQYGFTENQDYILVSQKSEIKGKGGDRRSLDYYLTIDMAKELAMVERTDRGREARRYFISCEKQLIEQQEQKQLPQSSQRFLVLMENGQITSAQPVPIDCYAFRHEDIPRILKEHGKIAINKQDLITITRAVIEIKTALDRMDDDESQNEKLSHASH